eukprot:14348529-Ditylum_brightwellii.AAC.1
MASTERRRTQKRRGSVESLLQLLRTNTLGRYILPDTGSKSIVVWEEKDAQSLSPHNCVVDKKLTIDPPVPARRRTSSSGRRESIQHLFDSLREDAIGSSLLFGDGPNEIIFFDDYDADTKIKNQNVPTDDCSSIA